MRTDKELKRAARKLLRRRAPLAEILTALGSALVNVALLAAAIWVLTKVFS